MNLSGPPFIVTEPVRHPLIGKIVRYDVEDGAAYRVSRFTADLGNGLMLAKHISPHTGEDLRGSEILVLMHLAHDDMTEIYDDWAAMRADMEQYEPAAAKRVVQLVPKDKDDK
ncbi:MAG: hypothetical protein J2P48_07650 [Alphaproteobacteria bacterium]|nr:hypothetical protein [Alphaproteobacteria bacterium]